VTSLNIPCYYLDQRARNRPGILTCVTIFYVPPHKCYENYFKQIPLPLTSFQIHHSKSFCHSTTHACDKVVLNTRTPNFITGIVNRQTKISRGRKTTLQHNICERNVGMVTRVWSLVTCAILYLCSHRAQNAYFRAQNLRASTQES
jgi:hypothetical protein